MRSIYSNLPRECLERTNTTGTAVGVRLLHAIDGRFVVCDGIRMICPCNLPASGEKAYDCERLGCRMTPHWCGLYCTRGNYRMAWDAGRGPGQNPPQSDGRRRRRSPCNRPQFSGDTRRVEDQAFALQLCQACEYYDRLQDICQAGDCARLNTPCTIRVTRHNDGCPYLRW